MLIHQVWFTALYTQHLLNSHSFEFVCILQALNMPLICYTNIFFQVRLSRHITSPSEKTRPGSLGPGTTWVRQLCSGSCHHPTKCNEQPSQATANPVGGKACSSTKGGLLCYILNTYLVHKILSLKFAYYKHSICRLYVAPTYFFKGGYPVTFVHLRTVFTTFNDLMNKYIVYVIMCKNERKILSIQI